MNINKNISVWSGSEIPPTKYHLWIRNDGQYIFDGKDWVPSPVRIQLYKDTVKISTSETQDIYYTYKEDVFEIDSSTDEDVYNKELTTDVPCTLYWSFYCLNSEQTPLSSSFNYEVRFYWNINQQNQWEWSDWISNYTPPLINKGDFETHVISVTKEMLDISKQNDERKDIGITQYEIRKKNTDTPITQLGQRFHIVGRKYYNDLSILYDYIDNKFTESSEEIEQTYIKKTEKGVANGVAPLDEHKLILPDYLPSYVDDVIEVYASFDKSSSGALENIQLYLDKQKTDPVVGERGKIYIDLLTNYQFRWSGTIFTPISIPDSSIVDLGQFENETAADNVMLADNTGVIFNSQCLIVTYKIGEQRAIIINQYNTERSVQHKYFNGRKYFRYINHNNTTVTEVQEWELDDAVNLLYNESTRILSHSNRYGDPVGDVATLPLVTSEHDGLMSKEDKGSLDDNTTKISSIFNGNPPLANISLEGHWTIYNQDNSEIQQQPQQNTNPTVEYGYKAKYSGKWKWTPVTNGKPPKTTSGPWGPEVPKNDNNISSLFTSSDYLQGSQQGTITHTYTQTISAPKLGLMVKGSDVVKAEGVNDSKFASTSITFKHKLYYGKATSSTPSADIIKSLTSNLDDRTRDSAEGGRLCKSYTGVSTAKGEYYYFAYSKSLGALFNIKQGGYDIPNAFNLSVVNITNTAGLSIDLYVYVSKNSGAFTNQILKFIWP